MDRSGGRTHGVGLAHAGVFQASRICLDRFLLAFAPEPPSETQLDGPPAAVTWLHGTRYTGQSWLQ